MENPLDTPKFVHCNDCIAVNHPCQKCSITNINMLVDGTAQLLGTKIDTNDEEVKKFVTETAAKVANDTIDFIELAHLIANFCRSQMRPFGAQHQTPTHVN